MALSVVPFHSNRCVVFPLFRVICAEKPKLAFPIQDSCSAFHLKHLEKPCFFSSNYQTAYFYVQQIGFFSLPPYATARIWTRVSRVAPIRDLLKDALPTELLRHDTMLKTQVSVQLMKLSSNGSDNAAACFEKRWSLSGIKPTSVELHQNGPLIGT